MSATGDLRCTVVVCTRDRPALLGECLEALRRQDFERYDLLVVDSGPAVPAREVAERWGAGYLCEPSPGLSRARNAGARHARGDVVAYTDDDALPEPGWVSALMKCFDDPSIAAATGRLRLLAERDGQRMTGEEAPGDWASRPPRIFDRATDRWFVLAALGGIGSGANMAIRRSIFDAWPGFDERLGRGAAIPAGEENFAWASLIERGFRIAYTPDAVVKHPYPSTEERLKQREGDYLRVLGGYSLLLMREFRQRRAELLRYMVGATLGVRTARWRPRYGSRRLSRWQRVHAFLRGMGAYLARRER